MKFDFYNEAKQKINDSLEILVEEDANFVTKLDLFVAKTMANEYFYPAAFFGELKARVLEIQQIETLSHLVKAEGCYYYIYSCLLSMAEKLGFTAHQFDLAFFLLHGNDQQMFINLCKSTGEDAYNISTSAISIFVSFYNWISASYKATVKQDGTFIALNVVFDAVIDAVSKKPNITM
ncbi:MAG: hypothetical protein IKY10_00325, partial [Clostridia bacterium]|nr:hypothetical protein [Clostridia bacterium]